MQHLRRTTPFLRNCSQESGEIILDRFTIGLDSFAANEAVYNKIAHSLDLGALGHIFTPNEAALIVQEHYEVCLEYIFSHNMWNRIRVAHDPTEVYAYLLETRHYLAAAAPRMGPSIQAGYGADPLTLLLSHHLLEEYDHSKFYESALEAIGCPRQLVISARPMPTTVEWIHLTRAIASTDGLAAALCSGLMEFSGSERDTVRAWHDMLVAKLGLPNVAAKAIYGHVETDLDYGHSNNWRIALNYEIPITSLRLSNAFNAVSTIAEMIYRWLDCLVNGISKTNVNIMPLLQIKSNLLSNIDSFYNGIPVWPSTILDIVTHGANISVGSLNVVAAAFSFCGNISGVDYNDEWTKEAARLTSRLASPAIKELNEDSIIHQVTAWLRSIDGHNLWQEMTDRPTYSLVQGFLLENCHYISSATRHISSAISACDDPIVRSELIDHLEDEVDHSELLKSVLEGTPGIISVDIYRPLCTTQAFIGYLRDLGAKDWKSYCIAIAFLQVSLASCRGDMRHSRFYETVTQKLPSAGPLLEALHDHDKIDDQLGHDQNASRRLAILFARHKITEESVARAALVPQLAWSFLDGILHHYRYGLSAIRQRVGWTANINQAI